MDHDRSQKVSFERCWAAGITEECIIQMKVRRRCIGARCDDIVSEMSKALEVLLFRE